MMEQKSFRIDYQKIRFEGRRGKRDEGSVEEEGEEMEKARVKSSHLLLVKVIRMEG